MTVCRYVGWLVRLIHRRNGVEATLLQAYLRAMRGIFIAVDAKAQISNCLSQSRDGRQLLASLPEWLPPPDHADDTDSQPQEAKVKWKRPGEVEMRAPTRGKYGNSKQWKPSDKYKQAVINLISDALPEHDFSKAWRAYRSSLEHNQQEMKPEQWAAQHGGLTNEQVVFVRDWTTATWRRWVGGVKIGGIPRGTFEASKQGGRYGSSSSYFQEMTLDGRPLDNYGFIEYFVTVKFTAVNARFELAACRFFETIRREDWPGEQEEHMPTLIWEKHGPTEIIMAASVGQMVMIVPAHRSHEEYARTLRRNGSIRMVLGAVPRLGERYR